MLPSIFGESLFDDFFDFPFERASRGHDPLYGKHGKNLMKTDIKEKENSYEVDIDLPGFKKEDIKIHLEDGFLTVTAQKALDKDEKDQDGHYIRRERYKQRLNVFACSYIGKRLIDVCNPIACRKAADLFVPLRMAKHKINISLYVVH